MFLKSSLLNKIFFWILPLLAIFVWVLDAYASPPVTIVKGLAKLSGLIGIAFIANSFLHASRFGFVEKIYGGLDKVYKSHKKSGRYAYVFIFLHPLFLATSSVFNLESLKLHYIPGSLLNYNTGMGAFYLLNILLLFTLVIKLPYHIWKYTHKLMIVVLFLSSVHVFQNSFGVVWLFNFVLIVLGTGSFIYREWIYGNLDKKYIYEISAIRNLGIINELQLKPRAEKLLFKAGQFVFIKFLDSNLISKEAHPFSISSDPHDEIIRISAKSLGDYTSTLDRARVGDLVKIVGPHGYFTVDKTERKQLWISGGIGTTPFLSMVNDSDVLDLVFVHSNKNNNDAVYLSELQEKSKAKDFKLIPHFSDSEGFINAEYIQNNIPDFKEREIYICGPSVMMYALRDMLIKLGVEKDRIKFEDFNFK